ncbi:glycosyltransferase family 2 protein [Asticcacaulis sp. YBE204]|uniref:glycosyltransferase family 2 protein n=1 Tax=Asticcacaulis sp. YBE204 TaxID=1282363 RepID=UPI0003C3C756|nr:glycosyltransferase family 2 protein [Asticcacaulis sp. YBE204]ESQ78638.1 hypothetical protein AEYBE204_13890 [Asticcacaulis sp. YBE204]
MTAKNPDLAQDLKTTEGDLSLPAAGSGRFALNGLYRLSSDAPIELEFTEQATQHRTLIYSKPGQNLFLHLPDGNYGVHYRALGTTKANRLSMQYQGALQKLGLYAAKAMQIASQPARWGAAWRELMRRRSDQSVGLSLGRTAPSSDIEITPRAPELPQLTHDAVSIIIPTKTRYDLLRDCLDSLRRIKGVIFEAIIVDNGATHPDMLTLLDEAAKRPDVRVVRHDIPFNFSRLCNLGAAEAKHPLLLFLNDDIEALDGAWLRVMTGFAGREDVGVVGARLLYPSRDLQHGGVATHLVPGPGHPWRNAPESVWRTHPLLSVAGEVDAVTGACLMIRRDLFDRLGGFDETRFAITLNDVDLCLKARRAGLKVIYAPDATLLHKEGQSRGDDDAPAERERRARELKAFVEMYPDYARQSVFYPPHLRRDTDTATAV